MKGRRIIAAVLTAATITGVCAPAAQAAKNDGFYRSRLSNDWEKGLYDACVKTWKSGKSYSVTYKPSKEATFPSYDVLTKRCLECQLAAVWDHPEIYFVKHTRRPTVTGYASRWNGIVSEAGKTLTLKIDKSYAALEDRSISDKFENALNELRKAKADALVSLKGKSPREYRELLAINAAMKKHAIKYDDSKRSGSEANAKYQNAYSATVERKAVCVGFATLFKILCDESGIECLCVKGSAVNANGSESGHMWNYVRLSEKWYIVDEMLNFASSNPKTIGNMFLIGTDTKVGGRRIGSVFIPSKSYSYPELSKKKYGA